ncbi:MAG: sulfite exporter TauE/SafE family protein [Gammaproteobacteria bacterium]|uniref:sulfite exporter TauE/SafE family protein n=1 Tax=Rhodoferax sp. TaxID=50421 RepID=UPI001845F58A|nr:sulfite exporter TauE/SafE family protein [Rhodoferax sp.]MBU3898989.1 sulfite exporter TauE/SafE family protein [Gammaproteobacteria bacterium]MBA3056979.1 sulfite exporter TauE/SafE family protein [Rhodoferax sp.]MBU3998207.1 sulfite exporter TauE/SafE family protein [Gammaproteobacteria bacterium]MBU4018432.1 sulfite exporter TauE/SafE family protein [Gammaproteobacteria bacterium]MBU4080444.1 sulfite exporter TauE/SafE family protein [Gammaproteobacteria bacterium]
MQSSLAVTALLMGLVGGPHCIAMCGAACAGIGQAAGVNKNSAMWSFQAGRVLGYSALGALAAASIQGLGWLTVQSAALRPVWTLFHVATLVLGLLLLWKAQQPVWLEQAGKKIWTGARSLAAGRGRGAPMIIGALWTFLPCGLLYSALLVAALTGHALEGAGVMALFALGTSVSMMAGPWLWLRLRGNGVGDWGVRLAGLALAGSSAWALWMAYAHDAAPWCVTP